MSLPSGDVGELWQRFWSPEGLFPDWADWLIAFCIAYMLVKHGGAIFNMLAEVGGGLTAAIMLFLP